MSARLRDALLTAGLALGCAATLGVFALLLEPLTLLGLVLGALFGMWRRGLLPTGEEWRDWWSHDGEFPLS